MVDAGIRETPIRDVVGLTIALGTPEITVLEQCTAFATFAKNGTYSEPLFLREIRSPDGFVWKKYEPVLESEAIPPNVAYVVTYMMEGVARWGTGARSRPLGDRPRAGKTGTTNDSVDVWFCGFTKQYTAVVWMGYRGGRRSLGQGSNYTGGRLACPIWTEFMLRAHEGLPEEDFDVPPGVKFYNVDKSTGLKGGNFREAFLAGTQPPTVPPIFPDESTLEPLGDFELPPVIDEREIPEPPIESDRFDEIGDAEPIDLLAPFEGL
jgi:penicillin-binding protein 1A